jgi:hypothetical protein
MNFKPCLTCNTIPKIEEEYQHFYKTNWVYLKCNCPNKITTATGNTIDQAKLRASLKWNRKNSINLTKKEENLT